MKLLCLSGSTRTESVNSALLRALAERAGTQFDVEHCRVLDQLPIFNPDLEGALRPESVRQFCVQIAEADVLVISSPEYVRAIPGGLKNAIDWLVSGEEIMNTSIALAHASHRGDDMLESLRTVLSTVSTQFMATPFLRIPLMSAKPQEADIILYADDSLRMMDEFLAALSVQLES